MIKPVFRNDHSTEFQVELYSTLTSVHCLNLIVFIHLLTITCKWRRLIYSKEQFFSAQCFRLVARRKNVRDKGRNIARNRRMAAEKQWILKPEEENFVDLITLRDRL